MNRSRHQLFAGSAFTGYQNAAGLRSHGGDQVKNSAHFRAPANDVVVSREAAQFTAQVAGLIFQPKAFLHLADGATQLVHQFVIFDDVAIGTGVNGSDGGLHGGHTGDQQKDSRWSHFLGVGQQIDTAHVWHANVRNDDVE